MTAGPARPGTSRRGRTTRRSAPRLGCRSRWHSGRAGGPGPGRGRAHPGGRGQRAGLGPHSARRLVVATADPGTLPDKATWYPIRTWIEQSYKQVKDELGWAGFQVRSDIAIRRHQPLVNCAFSSAGLPGSLITCRTTTRHRCRSPGCGERGGRPPPSPASAVLAAGTARGTRLAFPWIALQRWRPACSARAPAAASPDQLGRGRLRPAPLHPHSTNYR